MKRQPQDYYPTPAWVVNKIFQELDIPEGTVMLEPCRGNGVIYDRFPPGPHLWAELSEGVDYLKTPFQADLIITNPPYSHALQFLQKSLWEAPTVIYLLRVSFLGAQKRYKFWVEHEPTHLFVLSNRPSYVGSGTDQAEYAWYCWDQRGIVKRPPGIYHLL